MGRTGRRDGVWAHRLRTAGRKAPGGRRAEGAGEARGAPARRERRHGCPTGGHSSAAAPTVTLIVRARNKTREWGPRIGFAGAGVEKDRNGLSYAGRSHRLCVTLGIASNVYSNKVVRSLTTMNGRRPVAGGEWSW
ncbi:hypothetical protein GCM10018772_44510 [Streptomyces fumanus]|uniref:Uncharacterized protein n=1 Tax=Streptomyces fumanus TaxID=67302 RepID=A0A919AKU2_9ACTN|nr:hypothetical protein GCM10018772_44510 [Streptomyces fumanus]